MSLSEHCVGRFKVKNRINLGYEVKPSALQLEGKTFTFIKGWVVEDIGMYIGEKVWIPDDPNYPKDAPTWIAEGDLVSADGE